MQVINIRGNYQGSAQEDRSTWELSVLSAQFFCKPETALTNKKLHKNKCNLSY